MDKSNFNSYSGGNYNTFKEKKFYLLGNGKCGVMDKNEKFEIPKLEIISFNEDNSETMNNMKLKISSIIDDIKVKHLEYPTTKPNDDYSSIYPKPEIPDDVLEAYEGSNGDIPKEDDDGLSGGAIAGIVIGCFVGVLLICVISLCVFRALRNGKKKVTPENA